MEHPSEEVQQALNALNDALCTWERSTGRESVLILRESGGFVSRSASGKLVPDSHVVDAQLIATIVDGI